MQLREGSKVSENGVVYLVEEVLSDCVTLLRVDMQGPVEYEHKRELSIERVRQEFELVSP